MSGFPKAVRDLVRDRAADHCEVCGLDRPEQLHHRRARGMGSTTRPDTNTASNALFISSDCHRRIESRRSFALDRGWLVRQTQSPSDVPVLWQGSWVLLQDTGGVFYPPAGAGRCERCGCHVPSQGHRNGCQVTQPKDIRKGLAEC